jgi:hypothetical protein
VHLSAVLNKTFVLHQNNPLTRFLSSDWLKTGNMADIRSNHQHPRDERSATGE